MDFAASKRPAEAFKNLPIPKPKPGATKQAAPKAQPTRKPAKPPAKLETITDVRGEAGEACATLSPKAAQAGKRLYYVDVRYTDNADRVITVRLCFVTKSPIKYAVIGYGHERHETVFGWFTSMRKAEHQRAQLRKTAGEKVWPGDEGHYKIIRPKEDTEARRQALDLATKSKSHAKTLKKRRAETRAGIAGLSVFSKPAPKAKSAPPKRPPKQAKGQPCAGGLSVEQVNSGQRLFYVELHSNKHEYDRRECFRTRQAIRWVVTAVRSGGALQHALSWHELKGEAAAAHKAAKASADYKEPKLRKALEDKKAHATATKLAAQRATADKKHPRAAKMADASRKLNAASDHPFATAAFKRYRSQYANLASAAELNRWITKARKMGKRTNTNTWETFARDEYTALRFADAPTAKPHKPTTAKKRTVVIRAKAKPKRGAAKRTKRKGYDLEICETTQRVFPTLAEARAHTNKKGGTIRSRTTGEYVGHK